MHIHNFLFCVILCLFSPVFSDEDFIQLKACCTFKGPGFKDIEYIIENRFNRKLMMQYNSTRSKWKGFTPFAIETANNFSRDPYDALQRVFEMKTFCKDNIDVVQQSGNLTSAPTIKMNLVKHPSMLVCSAYNFYPKQIRMTWLRNGEEATSAVSFSEVMSDGDWYYQVHSYLVHTPTHGERITCMVEHLTLSEPVFQVWDPSLPVTQRIKIGVGVFALVFGFVILISGFIYYKKNSAAHFTFCQEMPEVIIYPRDEVVIEEENTLICFVNHFFPPIINIKWTRNDTEIKVEDPFIKCIPNPIRSLRPSFEVDTSVGTMETSVGSIVYFGLATSFGLVGVATGTFFFVKGRQIESS